MPNGSLVLAHYLQIIADGWALHLGQPTGSLFVD